MLKKLFANYINAKRWRWREKNNISRLQNTDFTIISNNCDAGIIYNSLRVKFFTPTINLWLEDEDYLKLIYNLKEYIEKGQLEELEQNEYSYPVGLLKAPCGEVKIKFMHYKTFEQAKEKWIERSKRINWNNLFFLFEVKPTTSSESIKEFESLIAKNKAMISFGVNAKSESLTNVKIKGEYVDGIAVKYQSKFSAKRWLDEFDYVTFLNGQVEKN